MISFVYGASGTGKSTFIYKKILEKIKNGEKVCLIVPEPQAYISEKRIVDMSEGIPTHELEVLSFRRLCNRVFREYGGLSFNNIDDASRMLVMWRTVCEVSPFFKEYNASDEKDRAFVELMMRTVIDLKQNNIYPFMLEKTGDKLSETNPSLSSKLHDIALVYSEYQAFLKDEYDDPDDELTRLSATLENNAFFKDYSVYFDSFDGFTFQQYEIISKIIRQADSVCFSLCYDEKDESGVFNATKHTLSVINKMALKYGIKTEQVYFDTVFQSKSEEIRYISKNLWNHNVRNSEHSKSNGNVLTYECYNAYEQCEAVTVDILKKVRQGIRFRDISVIARDITLYEGILDSFFEANDIPFFMSRRSDLKSKTVFRLILSVFAIKKGNFKFEDVISYIKTGLTDISYDECDLIENYVSMWNIEGQRWYDDTEWTMNPDGFCEKVTEEQLEKIKEINSIRKKIVLPLVKFFDCIGNTDFAEVTKGLYTLLCELNVREKLEKQAEKCHIQGEFEKEKELCSTWNTLMSALDTVVDICGNMKADPDNYFEVISILFDKTDIGTIPAKSDEVVVSSASSVPMSGKKCVYIIGANEGEFPRKTDDDSVFSDKEKELLSQFDIQLNSTTKERSEYELFWFYRAISSAVEYLIVTYSSSDLSGKTRKISIPASRINYLLGDEKPISYSKMPFEQRLEGKQAFIRSLCYTHGTDDGKKLLSLLENDGSLTTFDRNLDIPLSASEDTISTATAEKLYEGNITTSQSRLESFVKCPFEYHCEHVLHLKENKKAVLRPSDIGTFVHAVLERFMAKVCTQDGIDTSLGDDEIARLVDSISNEYIQKVCGGIISQARTAKLFQRLRNTTLLLVGNIMDEFRQSEFVPMFFELPIGKTKGEEQYIEPYEIPISDGSVLKMQGIADRVDVYKKDGNAYIRVVDYKTGEKRFSLDDVAKGINLQMLLYLYALCNTKAEWFREKLNNPSKIDPAGILYFSAQPPDVMTESNISDEEIYQKASGKIKRSGLLVNDTEILSKMEKHFEGKYIPVLLGSDGITPDKRSANNLKTLEEFGILAGKIKATVDKNVTEMKKGNINAVPLKGENPCEYCKMKVVCRSKGGE